MIVTGVFTVSGILDSFIYHGQKAIKKKMEIGKFSWSLHLTYAEIPYAKGSSEEIGFRARKVMDRIDSICMPASFGYILGFVFCVYFG